MCLVHIQPVYTELLKGHNIVLSCAVLELFQFRLQILPRFLQLLDGKPLRVGGFQFLNAVCDLVDLLIEKPLLPLLGYGNFLKL